jgi:hypothetical protein
MSCGIQENKDYENLLGTNKQLFCGVCWIYDCNIHLPPDNNFDSPQCYNVKDYLKTNRYIYETALSINQEMMKLNTTNENDVNNNNNSNNNNEYCNTVLRSCEKYNSIVLEKKLSHFGGYITNVFDNKQSLNEGNGNVSSSIIGNIPINNNNSSNSNNNNNLITNQSIKTIEKIGDICGEYCYKNFLKHVSTSTKENIYQNLSKPLPNLYEIYLPKLVQIFKYDPCSITKCLKMISLSGDALYSNITDNMNIECYVTYIRLLMNDYSLDKPLTKECIDCFIKERTNDKKKIIESQRLKQIQENARNSKYIYNTYITYIHIDKIIPYQPCYHLGNEPCNELCPCRIRGFCEKYCACNKQLCKLFFSGCHCKGSCTSSLCPCFIGNRECDVDLCQNCKDKHSQCKNMKLAKNEHKKLGIANSSIAGWGLFANEDIKKEDLIGEYIGEMVGIEDLNERSEYIDLEKTTYMFTLNDEYTVDSRTMGNILRFANHSKSKANAYAKIVFSKGNHKICLYASDDIKKGQEIFFDYDGQNILCEK